MGPKADIFNVKLMSDCVLEEHIIKLQRLVKKLKHADPSQDLEMLRKGSEEELVWAIHEAEARDLDVASAMSGIDWGT